LRESPRPCPASRRRRAGAVDEQEIVAVVGGFAPVSRPRGASLAAPVAAAEHETVEPPTGERAQEVVSYRPELSRDRPLESFAAVDRESGHGVRRECSGELRGSRALLGGAALCHVA